MKNTFKFVVPAELEKAEDGSYKVRGLASTQKIDQQGETIIQKGVDLTPIDQKKGILNWDHQKGPENTIGLLDGYTKTGNGLYVEGRLFKNHSKAKAVKEIMESLGEGDRGRMGLSVEGKILKRNAQNPAIIEKCQINAVALTMNPVNADTFADIVKSMNAGDVEFNSEASDSIEESSDEPTFTSSQVMAIVQKALGIGAGQAQAPADRSGGDALGQESMDKDKKKKKKESEEDKGERAYKSSGPRIMTVDSDKVRMAIRELKKHFGIKNTMKRTALHWLRNNTPLNSKELRVAIGSLYKSRRRKMSMEMYKSNLVNILDKLQVLYPEHSRSEIWEAVKDRLDTKFTDEFGKAGLRLKQTDAKEREHKLYEEARQRSDYSENKDKTRAQLAEIARESGTEKKEQAKIRAQADAAKQVGDRDHTRPGVGR